MNEEWISYKWISYNKDKGDSNMWAVLLGLGAIVLILAVIVGLVWYSMWANAFVLMQLWVWFIIPVFGFDPLTLPMALGLSLIAGFVFSKGQIVDALKTQEESPKKAWGGLIALLILPWVTLFVGWIITKFI